MPEPRQSLLAKRNPLANLLDSSYVDTVLGPAYTEIVDEFVKRAEQCLMEPESEMVKYHQGYAAGLKAALQILRNSVRRQSQGGDEDE